MKACGYGFDILSLKEAEKVFLVHNGERFHSFLHEKVGFGKVHLVRTERVSEELQGSVSGGFLCLGGQCLGVKPLLAESASDDDQHDEENEKDEQTHAKHE